MRQDRKENFEIIYFCFLPKTEEEKALPKNFPIMTLATEATQKSTSYLSYLWVLGGKANVFAFLKHVHSFSCIAAS